MPVFPDWYVCLSVALDEEESEWYNRQYLAWISAQQDPKKFPKRPKRDLSSPAEKRKPDTFSMVMDTMRMSGVKIGTAKGNVGEYAEARGLQKVYQMPDGTLTDENGNPVEPTPGSVFVKSKGP
jgi:hypothetical protein